MRRWRELLVGLIAASRMVHADTSNLDAGAAIGAETQLASTAAARGKAGLPVLELHGGAYFHPWIEAGLDLELGQGDGVRKLGGLAVIRLHVGPTLRVHPHLMIGTGFVEDNGTSDGDAQTGFRWAWAAGLGFDVHVGRWTVAPELRGEVVQEDNPTNDQPETRAWAFAHGPVGCYSVRVAGVYRF